MLLTFQPSHAEVGIAIAGSVKDSNGVPLSAAHVCVLERQVIVSTGLNGRYQIMNLPSGDYTLEVSRVGFRTCRIKDVEIREGIAANVNVILTGNPVELPAATVTSGGRHLQFRDNVLVVTSAQWKEEGLRSVSQVLHRMPNVSILDGDRDRRISLRGSPARAVKVFLDGVPLNDAGTGEADISRIQLENLEAITVEMDAVGGEVHFMTVKPGGSLRKSRKVNLSGGFGSYTSIRNGLRVNKHLEPVWGSLFIERMTEKGNFKYRKDNGAEFIRMNNHQSATSGIGKLSVDACNWELEGGLYYEESNQGSPGPISTAPTPAAELSNQRISGSINGHHKPGVADIRCNLFYSGYVGRYLNPARQYNPEIGRVVTYTAEDNQQAGSRLGLRSTLGIPVWKTDLLLDYNFQVDWYSGKDRLRDVSTISGVGSGKARRTTHQAEAGLLFKGAGWGIDWKVNPSLEYNWIINQGADNYLMSAPGISISVDKAYPPLVVGMNLSWGKTLIAPPFNALFMVESMFAVGNRELKPERGESWNVGFLASSGAESNLDWSANVNLFYRRTENLIIWRVNSFGKYFPDNVARARIAGIELDGRLQVLNRHVTVAGNYTFNDPRNDTPGDINFGNMPPLVARHNGTASVTARTGGVTVSLLGRWISRRYSTESNLDPISTADMELAPYSVYDLSVGYDFTLGTMDITIETAVKNMFNESYRIVERSPMPGRSYLAELSVGML